MKVLMVNKFLYPRGGAETYFLRIGAYLAAQGHNVQYFGMKDEKNVVGNEADLLVKTMEFHGKGADKLLYPFRIIYSREAKRKISKVIKAFQPDIVHLNNINFHLTPSVIDACHDLGVPVVQTVHDYQMVCPNHLMYNGEKRICDACLSGSKWNCFFRKCIHGSSIKSFLGSVEAKVYQHRKNYDKVSRYICPSRFMEKMLLTDPRYQGKTLALHNFVEQADISGPTIGDEVVYFGRLSEEKGIGMLMDACRLLPDIPFVVAGTGPAEHKVTGVPNVRYVGFKTGEDLHRLIAGARFTVYPSIWYENCPLSILEAQSMGIPVVSTKLGGTVELIEHEKTGVLISSLDAQTLADAIQKLYQSPEDLKRMRQACLDKREYMITLPDYCSQLLDVYQTVCGNRTEK